MCIPVNNLRGKVGHGLTGDNFQGEPVLANIGLECQINVADGSRPTGPTLIIRQNNAVFSNRTSLYRNCRRFVVKTGRLCCKEQSAMSYFSHREAR